MTDKVESCEALVFEADRERCGAPGGRMIDPYMSEVYGEDEEIVLCAEHEQQRRDDV